MNDLLSALEPWPFGELQRRHYGVILADPPWSFANYSPAGWGKSPHRHYACMPLADIQALPVVELAAPDCMLVMWATAPMLPHALETIAAWGFTYCTMGAWAKQSATGAKWNMGTGYRLRSAVEPFLLASRGNPKQFARNVRNLVVAPVREHSRKPDALRHACEALWPGPRVELFAREAAPGWDAWGNEVAKFTPAGESPASAPPPAAARATEVPPSPELARALQSLMGTERPGS